MRLRAALFPGETMLFFTLTPRGAVA